MCVRYLYFEHNSLVVFLVYNIVCNKITKNKTNKYF